MILPIKLSIPTAKVTTNCTSVLCVGILEPKMYSDEAEEITYKEKSNMKHG